MPVKLEDLLAEIPEVSRNSTTGALDNTKRTRGVNRTLQDMRDVADWDWTRRTIRFDLIDGLSEYSLQNYLGATCLDNDGETVISDFKSQYDLRVRNRGAVPFSWRDPSEVRDKIRRGRRVNEYAVDNDLLIINYSGLGSVQVHNCDSLTANGTWSAGGNATNLTIDEVNFSEGSGALNFDVSAGTSLVVSNTTMTSLDLSDYENSSYWTLIADLPTITNFTSITLRFGNDLTANYWEIAATARADGQDLEVGENLFAFKWANAVMTGSPSAASIDSVRVTIAYGSSTTDTDFRIDNIRVAKGLSMELEYYSLAMVETEDGNLQLEFNADETTMTDVLRGGTTCRRTVVAGAVYEAFKMIGGKSERDRTDSFKEYQVQLEKIIKRSGRRVKRPGKILNFPGRR